MNPTNQDPRGPACAGGNGSARKSFTAPPPSPRAILFLVLLAALAGWLLQGHALVETLFPSEAEAYVHRKIQDIRGVNPQAANALEKIREKRALAAALKAAEQTGPQGLSDLIRRIATPGTAFEIELARLAEIPNLCRDDAEREAFLMAHAAACQALLGDPSGKALNDYLDLLRKAALDPAAWEIVRDDPVGLILYPHLGGRPDLWKFYAEERDWLGEILVQVDRDEPGLQGDSLPPQSFEREKGRALADLVALAREHHDLLRRAAVDLDLGPYAFCLFLAYGPIIRRAVREGGLPLEETLAVLYANADRFHLPPEGEERARQAAQIGDHLVFLRRNRPEVWKAAQSVPLALWLEERAPQHAEEVLKKFGPDHVTVLLHDSYEEAVAPACAALLKFGDVAIYVLNAYAGNEKFKRYLNDPRVGVRLIPYVLKFPENPDKALSNLEDNIRWADRYFDAEGNPRGDPHAWLEAIPLIGAPGKVLMNWSKGYPCTWGELGWAALDVVDAALLVASLGASSGLTTAKQAAKTAGRKTVQALTREEALQIGKSIARGSAQKAAGGVLRATARESTESLLRRAARSAVPAARVLETGRVVVRWAGHGIHEAGRAASASLRALKAGWAASPTLRRWVFRGLFAALLFIRIKELTLPALPQLAEELGRTAGEFARSVAEGLGRALVSGVRGFMKGMAPASVIAWIIYGIVTVALAWALWRFRPFRRPRVQPA